MYVTVSSVIERYSGMPYTEFASTRIFAPLNMSDTSFSPDRANATGRFTQSWSLTGTRRIPSWFTDSESGALGGPGGIISSAADLSRWVTLLLGGDAASGAVPEAAYLVPQAARVVASGALTYGMGWLQTTFSGHPVRLLFASSASRRG